MKRPLLLFFGLCIGLAALRAQPDTLPADRRYDWSQAGAFDPSAAVAAVSLTDWPATLSDDERVAAALDALKPQGGTLYFPPGDYQLHRTISLFSGVHLRGAGADQTRLHFDLGGTGHTIEAIGATKSALPLTTGALRGDHFLVAADATIAPGTYLRTRMQDTDLVTSGWAAGSVGQLVRVTQVAGDTLFLDAALRLDLPLDRQPEVLPVQAIRDVGVHCLSIARNDPTPAQTSTIFWQYVVDGAVEGVESRFANFAHVTLDNSAHITVQHGYFHHAHAYGNGGQGYGVVVQRGTGDCLVENNVFEHLRHSMLLQAGANGNVLAHNYSHSPFWTGTTLPDDAAGDLVLHGNYVFANLLESNQVQNIVIDESHGANGPHNVFYRNRAEHYGLVMGFGGLTHAQSFVGNEITGTAEGNLGVYFVTGNNHYQRANRIKTTVLPPNSPPLLGHSLYRPIPPAYYDAELPVPLFGEAADLLYQLPAAYRADSLAVPAVCAPGFYFVPPNADPNDDEEIVSTIAPTDVAWAVVPNPVRDGFVLRDLAQPTNFELLDTWGRVIWQRTLVPDTVCSLANLPSGMYVLRAATGRAVRVVVP